MIAVTAEAEILQEQAAALARTLNLPLATAFPDSSFDYLLVLTPERLELRPRGPRAPGPVYVDFIAGSLAHRCRSGGGRRQPLARAVGLKGNLNPTVLDATAGLGRDAFVLACLGCTVQLVERAPIIAALLRDGLARAAADPAVGAWIGQRLQLVMADSRSRMAALSEAERPDVVYLDPMYPHRAKAALVKKEMRILRGIVGEDQDAPALLAAALGCARRRVVVKRPRLAPTLDGPPPDTRIVAKDTRFDIYLLF